MFAVKLYPRCLCIQSLIGTACGLRQEGHPVVKTLLQYSSLTLLESECYEGEVQPYRKTYYKPMMMVTTKKLWLQTTQPTSGGAVTAYKNCCANCVEPSRPQQWGPIYRFLGMRTRWMAGAAAHKSG